MSGPALRMLRDRGVDVIAAADAGLARADDATLLRWAIGDGRIVVTRNYRDFAPLVRLLASRNAAFPGVLFLASSIRHSDVRGHVRAVEDWMREASGTGRNPVEGGFGWLR